MPNHTRNVIRFSGEKRGLIPPLLANGEHLIDFQKIVPASEETEDAHITAWGTKWNAYCVDTEWREGVDDYYGQAYTQITFSTAWCAPEPIILTLRAMAELNDIDFQHWFSDEDGGSVYDPVTGEYVTIYTETEFS